MKILKLIILFIFLNINHLQGQIISPYLEIEESNSMNLFSNDSIINTFAFHHLLGQSEHVFYYTYYGKNVIDLNFIVPNRNNENITELSAEYNHQKVELKSKALREIHNQIEKLKKNSAFDNRIILENSILHLPKVEKGQKIKITLRKAIILDEKELSYLYCIPKFIGIRTKEFTATKKSDNAIEPKTIKNHFTISGNFNLDKVFINQEEILLSNALKISKSDNQNTDKRIKYSYNSKQINAGVSTVMIDNCQYNFGVIQPPKEIKNQMPREYIFVIDGSGSMKGKPIEFIKTSLNRILKQLNSNDKFNLLIYAADNLHFSSISLSVNEENIKKANQFLSKEFGNGNLKLNQAINRIEQLKLEPNSNRIISILSDGDIDFNPTIHSAIKEQMKNAQLFILGIGNEINYHIFNYFELVTGTKPIVVNDLSQSNTQLLDFEKLILHPVLKNVKITSKNNLLGEVYPTNFNGYLSNQSLQFITKDCNVRKENQLTIKGFNGNNIYENSFDLKAENSTFQDAIKYYWAKEKIAYLSKEESRCGDYCKKNKTYQQQIEKLANEYNISSPYNFLTQKDADLFSNDFDSDADLIPDWFDACKYEKGSLIAKGCPIESLQSNSKDEYIQDASNEILRIVEFDLDKAIIRAVDYKKLNNVVQLLNKNSKLKFDLIGHTDARGTKNYNYELALKRANAVKEFLVENGIDKSRLHVISKGDLHLKHTECNPAEQCEEWKNLENRRVELQIKKD